MICVSNGDKLRASHHIASHRLAGRELDDVSLNPGSMPIEEAWGTGRPGMQLFRESPALTQVKGLKDVDSAAPHCCSPALPSPKQFRHSQRQTHTSHHSHAPVPGWVHRLSVIHSLAHAFIGCTASRAELYAGTSLSSAAQGRTKDASINSGRIITDNLTDGNRAQGRIPCRVHYPQPVVVFPFGFSAAPPTDRRRYAFVASLFCPARNALLWHFRM